MPAIESMGGGNRYDPLSFTDDQRRQVKQMEKDSAARTERHNQHMRDLNEQRIRDRQNWNKGAGTVRNQHDEYDVDYEKERELRSARNQPQPPEEQTLEEFVFFNNPPEDQIEKLEKVRRYFNIRKNIDKNNTVFPEGILKVAREDYFGEMSRRDIDTDIKDLLDYLEATEN